MVCELKLPFEQQLKEARMSKLLRKSSGGPREEARRRAEVKKTGAA